MDTQIFRTDRKDGSAHLIVFRRNASFFKKESFYANYYYNKKLHTVYDLEAEDVNQFCKLFSIVFEIADRKVWNFNKTDMFESLYPFIKSDLYRSMWAWFNGGFDIQSFTDNGFDFSLKTPTFLLESSGDKCHVYVHDSRETPFLKYEDSHNEFISREQGELFLAVIGIFVEQLGLDSSYEKLPFHRGYMSAWNFKDWAPGEHNKFYYGNSTTFIDYFLNNQKYRALI